MIKTLTAFTLEADYAEDATAEILAQLNLEGRLLAHSVGMLTCHYQFVHSGVAEAVCRALPFDVAGVSTTGHAINGKRGIIALTLTVLTSDDVVFAAAGSGPMAEQPGPPLRAAYRSARAGLEENPALMLLFAPLLLQYAGDEYVDILTGESGNVPIFGTLSMDETEDFGECHTIFYDSGKGRAEISRDTAALVLVAGPVKPAFSVAILSGGNVLSRPARITKSEGNILKEVNGKRFVDFLDGLGLVEDGRLQTYLQLLVAVVDYKDGTPAVGKVLIQLNEEGYGVCGGYMPEGLDLEIAQLTSEDVLKTTGETLEKALQPIRERQADVLLCFSCNSRSMVLGSEVFAEMELVDELVRRELDGHAYLLALSGGEICPHVSPDGTIHNRFRNNSFVVCTF